MTLADRENSRTLGQRVGLYLVSGPEPTVEHLARSVTIGPGTSEFGYGTTRVTQFVTPANYDAGHTLTSFQVSLADLKAALPNVQHVNLLVGWFGTDLRCGVCEIVPKVGAPVAGDFPYGWRVGVTTRATAQVVSTAALGASPADRSVYEAVVALKAAGYRVTISPVVIMDIPAGNALPNPYGGTGQAAYPSHGLITCHPAAGRPGTVDKTATAATQVNTFFGAAQPQHFGWNAAGLHVTYSGPNEWSYRRFVLHMAALAGAAGADILIGSGLAGITRIRSDATTFPAVAHLRTLATETRPMVFGLENLLPVSANLSDAAWAAGDSGTATHGQADPFGGTTASIITDSTTGAAGRWTDEAMAGITAGETYTWSFYVKKNAAATHTAALRVYEASSDEIRVVVRLDTGEVSSLTLGSNVVTDAGSELVAGAGATEWWRVWITGTSPSDDPDFILYPAFNLVSQWPATGLNTTPTGSATVAAPQITRGAGLRPYAATTGAALLSNRSEPPIIGYAADWTEYGAYRPADGSGDVLFNLDPLWADDDIDFVGINYAAPMSDWRDGDLHLDRAAGHGSLYDLEYLWSHIEGGEAYAWLYATEADRTAQLRTPIEDPTAADEHWAFRDKDIRGWWENEHHDRPAGVRAGTPTEWTPESKPIALMAGVPAVNKGTNAPGAALPPYSNGSPDAAMQRAGLEALLSYWQREGGDMLSLDDISLSLWDARPYPQFPGAGGALSYADSANYATGRWLNGRVFPGQDHVGGQVGPFGFTNHEQQITRHGIVYEPVPIQHGTIEHTGTLDSAQIVVRLARGTDLDSLFLAYPPSQMARMVIREGHVGDDPNDPRNFQVVWAGTILSADHPRNEISLNCESIQSSLRRTGLRRHYQLGCPHALYGPDCRASKAAATGECTVVSISGQLVTLAAPGLPGPHAPAKFAGGLAEWTNDAGRSELRTIVEAPTAQVIRLRGLLRDLEPGSTIHLSLGCNRRMPDCITLHNNIHNYGGHPFIPTDNPLSNKNFFY